MTEPVSSPSWSRDLLLLTLVLGALFGFRLGSHPLANPDEGRYAEIPREMLAAGEFVTPRLDGVPYFEKPPLMYWAVAACLKAFGPNEWALRAAPVLYALGGVLLTYAAGRRLYGRAAGLFAAGMLGSSLLYFALTRILILDMAVSVLMSATLFCFILGVREPAPATGSGQAGSRRRWLFYGLYASAALATLTKGLIGFLVTGAVMFLWLLVFNQWKRLRPFYLPTGALLFLAIAAPWHILAAERNPGWARFYFLYEHWERFLSPTHNRYEPWWFFLPIVLLGLFPWVGFLWPALRTALAGGWARRKENADAWFLVTWAVFIFLFFSKSQSKLIPYILPVFPPLAVLMGAWLARAGANGATAGVRTGIRVFTFTCGLLAAALCVAVLKPGVIREPAQAALLRPYAFSLAAVLLLGGVATLWAAKVRGLRAGLAVLASTSLGFYLILILAAPYIQRPGTKELALQTAALIRPGDRVYHYHGFFHDFTFYAGRTVGTVAHADELELQFLDPAERAARFIDEAGFRRQWAGPGRLFVVARKRDVRELFADPAFRYHLLGENRDHYLFSNQP
ncbi:MAG: glycosyltransferase family 39 protein [Opitutaceae bacterium]|nr:glycosyltransferase family 39 protein [Opitutaceae bacterium]